MTLTDLVALTPVSWLSMYDADNSRGISPRPASALGRAWLDAASGGMWPNRMMISTITERIMWGHQPIVIL